MDDGPANPGGALKDWVRALAATARIGENPRLTLPAVIETLAERYGEAPALLSDAECLSYRALAERSNRYARWALRQGVAAGDAICLLMPNCPDYMAIWLGISRIGGVVALVNTQLTGESLAHAVRVAGPKAAIVESSLLDPFLDIRPLLPPELRCWAHGGENHRLPRIDQETARESGERLPDSAYEAPRLQDRALLIYTSGTTGLPKAANISHLRLMQWSHWFAGMIDTRPDDRMYNCLPMYHSVGGVVATGALLVNGGSVVLRRGFSARNFWRDIVTWDCTMFQYIGELCRHLANSPPHPEEARHRLRLCCGNGLRRELWSELAGRFRIPRILEFYAATEGSFSLYNFEGKPGAIGRIPSFLAHRHKVALVKFDVATQRPVRDASGFCIPCDPDEAGEAIGRIAENGSAAGGRFEGYTDAGETARKVLRDVFAPGDSWFRTGDLMRRDREGFFYFVDRIGDTFRWKGENVSTTEVAATIAACRGVTEAVVYGVTVPGHEGRAGMAALAKDPEFDLAGFRRHLARNLPEFAHPLFLRLRDGIEATSTFKPKKQELAREAYDPALIADPLYFNDRARKEFVTLDAALYARIQSGLARP